MGVVIIPPSNRLLSSFKSALDQGSLRLKENYLIAGLILFCVIERLRSSLSCNPL
jgi:hypothetical protein